MIERTSFNTEKIYWDTQEELNRQINSLGAKKIISIRLGVPWITTTKKCSDVYYEYYID